MTYAMTDTPTDSDILEFLKTNPDFLARHPDILAGMELPARTEGNVVDFQQLMVTKLRRDKQRAEDRHRTLINNARSNMTVQARVHAAIIRLVEAGDLAELADIINNELSLMLDVDIVVLGLETVTTREIANVNGIRALPAGSLYQFLADRDAALHANITGDTALYGSAARLVKSQALLRLHIAEGMPEALLAFGSRNPLLFADSQGVELIAFLGDVVERLLQRFLHEQH